MTGSLSAPPSPSSSTGKSKGYWVEDGTAHEDCQVLVVIRGAVLGSFRIDPGQWPSLRFFREGTVYFCPDCGDIWGRLVLIGHDGKAKGFECRRVSCEKHYDQWNIPGSILAGELVDLLDLLPPEVLRREALLHLR